MPNYLVYFKASEPKESFLIMPLKCYNYQNHVFKVSEYKTSTPGKNLSRLSVETYAGQNRSEQFLNGPLKIRNDSRCSGNQRKLLVTPLHTGYMSRLCLVL